MGRGGMEHGMHQPPFNKMNSQEFPGAFPGGMNNQPGGNMPYGNNPMGGRQPPDSRGGYNNPSMMIPQMPNTMGIGGPGQYGQNPN